MFAATVTAGADPEHMPIHAKLSEDALKEPQSDMGKASMAAKDDPVLRAFEDELVRSTKRLKLENHSPPYFISYMTKSDESFSVLGTFGALENVTDANDRNLTVDVRVGNYQFDSSGGGRNPGMLFFSLLRESSLEDSYDAIRHDLWLKTDDAYKKAVGSLEGKKALLEQKKVEDMPDSMSRCQPFISLKPAAHLDVDKQAWRNSVREISRVFRTYPAIINSNVWFWSSAQTRWFANNEGSLNREPDTGCSVIMTATAQAKDGMKVSDFALNTAKKASGLPTTEELIAQAKSLAERVSNLAGSAPVEPYRGPILFEGQAAGELFAQTLAPSLVSANEPLTLATYRRPFAGERIGRRILSPLITVVDDPLARDFHNKELDGGYTVDDEGVPAQKITLVEKGVLKTFCSGRTPSRFVKESNGHWQSGTAMPSQLFISSAQPLSLDMLRKRLIQLGKDEGLDYVFIVRHIESPYSQPPGLPGFEWSGVHPGYHLSQGGLRLGSPTLLYKLYVDSGKEELVRGASFTHLSKRMWRDIDATGDDSQVYSVFYLAQQNGICASLVTPSVLVSEIDIDRESHETDSPMLLPNPLSIHSTDRSLDNVHPGGSESKSRDGTARTMSGDR
jgi:predicted Zn-dependent protease